MQRHDSLSMPQINLEQLRTALRDGLAMRSSDHVDSVDRSPRARGGMGIMTLARGSHTKTGRKISQAYSTSMSSAAEPADVESQADESDDGSGTRHQGHSPDNGDDKEERAAKQASALPTQKSAAGISTMGMDMSDAADMVDANGQPVSDEIRDLLDSIDDGVMPIPAISRTFSAAASAATSNKPGSGMYGHLDETSCSSAVSTPVINHVN
ncbi:hypothetical protein LPJ57_003997 [Coemansia sp. RSA 486]|nr:hypothetical protein LPJ57_003997 [Coemansia sp. RSA 486]